MKVLVTSVGTATSVNLIKHFHKSNDYVVGVDINKIGYTAGSLLVDKFYQVSLAMAETYIEEIVDIIDKENVDLLIPINDIEVYVTARNIEKIHCKCIIPDVKTIEVLRDKYICSTFMKKQGLLVPDILDEDISIDRILRKRIGVGSKGIKVLGKNELCPPYEKVDSFLQKFVTGIEYTVDVLCDKKGNPIYIVPKRRLEVKSGVATKVKIEENNGLIKAVKDILSVIKLPGFSNIQFIRDNEDNYWFIEVNYRFSGGGGTTLAVVDDYLDSFKACLLPDYHVLKLNKNVKWGSIVTRYYEEVVYEEGVC